MEIDMEDKMLTLEKFEEASEIVRKVTQETKLVYSDFYSAQTGGKVYLKPENMQFTGAYKLRGAYYKISTLTEEEREMGLITASAGNHAQGVAYAAKCYGVKSTIVMMRVRPDRHLRKKSRNWRWKALIFRGMNWHVSIRIPSTHFFTISSKEF